MGPSLPPDNTVWLKMRPFKMSISQIAIPGTYLSVEMRETHCEVSAPLTFFIINIHVISAPEQKHF